MIDFIDEFGMRPPSVRGPCRTRPAWGRADLPGPADRPIRCPAGDCEAICREGTCHAQAATARDPSRASDRARRDARLVPEVQRVWEENFQVYGVRKVWRQLRREGFDVARCTVERLMKKSGIQGVIRGKSQKTTIPDPALPCPKDRVNRQFRASAPNRLWGRPSGRHRFRPDGRRFHLRLDLAGRPAWPSDRWRPYAELYVAFVIDAFADRIAGWRASRSRQTQFVLDALEQALHERRPGEGLTHHSDRGGQYLSRRYTERLAEAGLEPSVGSAGDSYDNALAETIIGLFKAEVIHRLGPWKTADAVEWETLRWVDWFNSRRLPGPIGNIPPAEAERNFADADVNLDMAA